MNIMIERMRLETDLQTDTEQSSVQEVETKPKFYLGIFFLVLSVILILDQISKAWILERLSLHQSESIIPDLFQLTLVMNKGVAFGMGSGLEDALRPFVLWGAMILAITVLLYLLVQDYRGSLVGQIGVAGILAGAIGNAIDRYRYGAVVDFLDFYWGNYHWPAFNVADSAICVGVVLLLAHAWCAGARRESAPSSQ